MRDGSDHSSWFPSAAPGGTSGGTPCRIPHICPFSPQTQFLVQYFPRDKTDLATKSDKQYTEYKIAYSTKNVRWATNQRNFRFLDISHRHLKIST